MKLLFSTILIFIIFFAANAQQDQWSEEGEIEDAEVVIEKDREIELPRASRNFERVPPLPVQKPQVAVSYRFVEVEPSLRELSPEIRVLKIKEPPLPKLYGNYVRAGGANYLTPYFDLFVNNTRNKDYSYGIHAKHLSSRQGPVDGANSGNSDTRLMFNGKYFAKKHTFSAEAGYQRERYHFYGYLPSLEIERDSIRQIFNIGHVQLGLQKSEPEAPFQYQMTVSLDRIGDRFGAVENQIGLGLTAGIGINDQLKFLIESESYLMDWKSYEGEEEEEGASINRNLVKFKPYLYYKPESEGSRIEAKAGFNIVYENDTIVNGDRLHFYPYLWAAYFLNDGVSLYAGIEGDIQKNTWLDYTRQNPYLASDAALAHTNKTFGFQGGIKGRVSSMFGFNVGLNANNYKNMYYFVNSAEDSTKFDILYDTDNTFLLNFYGEINFNNGNRFRSTLRGDYFSYTTSDVEEPWHKPAYQVNLMAHYNLYEKIIFNSELLVLGGIEGYNLASNTSTMLDPIIDLSFKADYLFSDRFSTFLQLKNILGQNYERYLNYPSRGIMVMVGATYRF